MAESIIEPGPRDRPADEQERERVGRLARYLEDVFDVAPATAANHAPDLLRIALGEATT